MVAHRAASASERFRLAIFLSVSASDAVGTPWNRWVLFSSLNTKSARSSHEMATRTLVTASLPSGSNEVEVSGALSRSRAETTMSLRSFLRARRMGSEYLRQVPFGELVAGELVELAV